ncbi:MAG: hypothetical protein GC164_02015 [Phycisphaera sp.]|nr:hypothetical protein [Phycisphaera sp.]
MRPKQCFTSMRFIWLLSTSLFILAVITSYLGWTVVRINPMVQMRVEPEYDSKYPRCFPYPDVIIETAAKYAEQKYSKQMAAPREKVFVWASTLFYSCADITLIVMLLLVVVMIKSKRGEKKRDILNYHDDAR